jgi:hypothetical protein
VGVLHSVPRGDLIAGQLADVARIVLLSSYSMTKCHWTYGQMFLAITVVSDRINLEQDRTTFRIDSTTRLYF